MAVSREPAPCRMPSCTGLVKGRGLCNRHYLRELRHGSPTAGAPLRILDDVERLWSRIDRTGDCWVWTASTTDGYGYTQWDGRLWRVHRLVYTLLIGPIPTGMQLDHLCRSRACCRPDHLEPVTHAVNVRRGLRSMRQTCPRNHPYDIRLERPNGRVERRCSICANDNRRRRREQAA